MNRSARLDATAPTPEDGFSPHDTEDEVATLLLRPLFPRDREMVLLAAFDAHERLVALTPVDGQMADRCAIAPRHWRATLRIGTRHLLMAHNHPSGDASPSGADIEWTREALAFLRFLGVDLVDHLIFTDAGHFSFRRAGLL